MISWTHYCWPEGIFHATKEGTISLHSIQRGDQERGCSATDRGAVELCHDSGVGLKVMPKSSIGSANIKTENHLRIIGDAGIKKHFSSVEEENSYLKAQVEYLKKLKPNLHGEGSWISKPGLGPSKKWARYIPLWRYVRLPRYHEQVTTSGKLPWKHGKLAWRRIPFSSSIFSPSIGFGLISDINAYAPPCCKEGLQVNHKKVRRLMRELGIRSVIRKKRPFAGRKPSVVFEYSQPSIYIRYDSEEVCNRHYLCSGCSWFHLSVGHFRPLQQWGCSMRSLIPQRSTTRCKHCSASEHQRSYSSLRSGISIYNKNVQELAWGKRAHRESLQKRELLW